MGKQRNIFFIFLRSPQKYAFEIIFPLRCWDYFSPSLLKMKVRQGWFQWQKPLLASFFSFFWFLPKKSVIHGQFCVSFQTSLLKSTVWSEWLKIKWLFHRKWKPPYLLLLKSQIHRMAWVGENRFKDRLIQLPQTWKSFTSSGCTKPCPTWLWILQQLSSFISSQDPPCFNLKPWPLVLPLQGMVKSLYVEAFACFWSLACL